MKASDFNSLTFVTSATANANEEAPILTVQPTRGNIKLNVALCKFLSLESGKAVDQGASGYGHARILHAGSNIFLCADPSDGDFDSYKLGPVTTVPTVAQGGAMSLSSTDNWGALGGDPDYNREFSADTENAVVLSFDAAGNPTASANHSVNESGQILDASGAIVDDESLVVAVRIEFSQAKEKNTKRAAAASKGNKKTSTATEAPIPTDNAGVVEAAPANDSLDDFDDVM